MRNVSDISIADRATLARNNVRVARNGARPMLICSGLGADQTLWRFLTPYFNEDWQLILFDHVGTGDSDRSAYDPRRYKTLNDYADDLLSVCDALELEDAVLVGHSIGAMIGVHAVNRDPSRIESLILIGASARYLNDTQYFGGFERDDIDAFLASLESNHASWSRHMAPLLVGNANRPELAQELANVLARMDPLGAKQFAEITMLSDSRHDAGVCTKPALILQCMGDIIVPIEASRSLHRMMRSSQYTLINARGHFPHLSAAQETANAMRTFLGERLIALD